MVREGESLLLIVSDKVPVLLTVSTKVTLFLLSVCLEAIVSQWIYFSLPWWSVEKCFLILVVRGGVLSYIGDQ